MNNADKVYDFVNQKIRLLQDNSPWSRSTCAKLRRGAGKSLKETPDVWDVALNGLYEENEEKGSIEVEWATYTALTLYAVHQQGNAYAVSASYSNGGLSFGSAIRRLMSPDRANEGSIKRRLDAIITSNNLLELSYHGRGIIQLIKQSEVQIKIDYPGFAKDLYYYQFPEGMNNVRLKWGRGFYTQTRKGKTEEEEC